MKILKALPVSLFQHFQPHQAPHSPGPFDVRGITETIQRALTDAGLNTQSGPMQGVTDTIHQALSAAGLTQRSVTPSEHSVTIEGTARVIDPRHGDIDGTPAEPTSRADERRPGAFLNRSFANDAGTRDYMLYIPASHAMDSEPVPLIVMLHGCTQSPADFAAGTRMNALADQHGFLVIYPAQAANANGSKCWNWFRPEDQVRDSGEPSLIAGITREVASAYRIDARRIFVAGMSAGASVAVILGAMYPELYVAVGAHSGLPYRAAHDMPSAFSAMQGGVARPGPFQPHAPTASHRVEASYRTPTIVFHGDNDRTVNARNGNAIVEQMTVVDSDRQPLRAEVRTGISPGGRRYKRTDYLNHASQTVVEQWLVHGAGHAWSGGSSKGTFTDPTGPDASAEMIRFFLSQRRAGTS